MSNAPESASKPTPATPPAAKAEPRLEGIPIRELRFRTPADLDLPRSSVNGGIGKLRCRADLTITWLPKVDRYRVVELARTADEKDKVIFVPGSWAMAEPLEP